MKKSLGRGQKQDKCVENSEAEFVTKKNFQSELCRWRKAILNSMRTRTHNQNPKKMSLFDIYFTVQFYKAVPKVAHALKVFSI